MIRIDRGQAPPVLVESAEVWLDEYRRLKRGDTTVPKAAEFRYRHRDIKAALVSSAHGKCMYCESLVRATHPGEVEHIFPVSVFPDLVVTWENLGFVCHDCNTGKRAYFEAELPVVDPYAEDPDEFFEWYGPFLRNRVGNRRARATVSVVGLNRAELLEARADRLTAVSRLLEEMVALEGGERRLVEHEVDQEARADRAFSATVRAYIKEWRLRGECPSDGAQSA